MNQRTYCSHCSAAAWTICFHSISFGHFVPIESTMGISLFRIVLNAKKERDRLPSFVQLIFRRIHASRGFPLSLALHGARCMVCTKYVSHRPLIWSTQTTITDSIYAVCSSSAKKGDGFYRHINLVQIFHVFVCVCAAVATNRSDTHLLEMHVHVTRNTTHWRARMAAQNG